MKDLFDKKYVHFMWEDELEGKVGFFAENVYDLRSRVKSNGKLYSSEVSLSKDMARPFLDKDGCTFRFFYYDPNYDCRRAYAEGKPIEQKSNIDGEWYVDVQPTWEEGIEYRIKPEEPKSKRMSYRELAE